MTKTTNILLKIFIFCFLFVSQLIFFTDFSRDPFAIQRVVSVIAIGGALTILLWQFKGTKNAGFYFSKADIALSAFVVIALVSLIINCFCSPNNLALLNNFLRKDFTLITGILGGYFLARLLCQKSDFFDTEKNTANYKYGFLFLLWELLWIPFNYFKMPGLFDIYGLLMWGAAFYLGLKILKQITLKNILDILLITATLASAYALCQGFGYDLFNKSDFSKDLALITSSTFGNPNLLSSFLLMALPFSIIFYLSSQDKGEKVYYFIINLICLTSLIISQARSSWIGAVFVLAVLMASNPFRNLLMKNKTKIALLLVGIFCIFLLYPHKTDSINKIADIKYSAKQGLFSNPQNLTLAAEEQALNASYHQRLMAWSCGINDIKKRPFLGWGWGAWQLRYAICQGELFNKYPALVSLKVQSNSAHNIFVETLTQSGFLGLITYLIFLVLVCSVCIRYYHTQKDISKKFLVLAAGGACVGFLTDNMLNISFQIQVICAVFYFFTGIIVSLHDKNVKIKISKSALTLFAVLGAFTFLYFSFIQTKILLASHYSLEGYFATKAKNYEQARKMFDKSISLFAENPETHFIYIKVLEILKDYSRMYVISLETLNYFPEYYEFYNIYGNLEARFNRPSEALSNLKISLSLNPYFKESFNLVLYLFIQFKELRTLENAHYIEGLKIPLAFRNAFSSLLWQIYFEQEDYEKARSILLEELARNKFDKNIQNKLALTNEKLNLKEDFILQEAQSLTELRNKIIKAKEIKPSLLKTIKEAASEGDFEAQMLLAQAYFRQKDFQNCRQILGNLYKNNSGNLSLNFAFASLEEAAGNKEEAKKYLQAVLVQDKENALALRRLKALN